MNTNFMGAVAMTKAVLTQMIARKEGHVVNINSISGVIGTPMRTSYSASKFAMTGYYEALRAELAHHNIKVTNIYPGHVRTNISANAVSSTGDKFGKVDMKTAGGSDPRALAKTVASAVFNQAWEVYYCSMKYTVVMWVKGLAQFVMPWLLRFHLRSQLSTRSAASA
jgi:short-subunit dehydrogenase